MTTNNVKRSDSSPVVLLGVPATSRGYNSTGNDADSEAGSSLGSSSTSQPEEHLTTVSETFLHLLKGYIGPGMLSLPWAVSQLGLPIGFAAVFVMSYWSSYNCWTVVRVKRYIERSRNSALNNNNDEEKDEDDRVSEAGSSVTTNTNITYPDVGEWAYGKTFQSYVSACICTQQLAICTVFISFIGENLMAVLQALPVAWGFWETHTGVMTMALPACLSLSFIPSLKGLAPVMAGGTVLLIVTLIIMGIVGTEEWDERPTELPTFALTRSPLALCAILYSYEGICLILPIESAMQEPKKFGPTFAGAMALVSLILASFSCCCVLAFGEVPRGRKFFGTQVLVDAEKEEEGEDENDLTGFDPLPPLPEHDTFAEEEEFDEQHLYDDDNNENREKSDTNGDLTIDSILNRGSSSGVADNEDSQSIRSFLSSAISFPNQMMPKMVLPGDSPQLRAALVLLTYAIAVVVPNVQALISLAGALAGSSSALLIPPVLELAWLDHLESGLAAAATDPSSGGPPMSPSMLALRRKMATGDAPADKLNKDARKTLPPPRYKYLLPRLKNYALLGGGFVFMLIGTYASLADIVAIYAGHD